MKKGLLGVLYAVAGAVCAIPVISFITFRKIEKRTVRFSAGEQRAIVNFKDDVFLVKEAADYTALSARCPHLGCTLRFHDVAQEFQCPCHGSVFDRSGKWVSGPAKKDLQKIPLNRNEGEDVIVTVTL